MRSIVNFSPLGNNFKFCSYRFGHEVKSNLPGPTEFLKFVVVLLLAQEWVDHRQSCPVAVALFGQSLKEHKDTTQWTWRGLVPEFGLLVHTQYRYTCELFACEIKYVQTVIQRHEWWVSFVIGIAVRSVINWRHRKLWLSLENKFLTAINCILQILRLFVKCLLILL